MESDEARNARVLLLANHIKSTTMVNRIGHFVNGNATSG
jgi:hypothetical protein